MIELQDVHKTYDTGTIAVNGISMKIDDGEFVFLVGPSGSGKSTIIKILTAELRPTSGSALVNNPSVIIADEPTGNLDPARSLEIMMLLEQINALGTTVLVVTHERELVNRFTKRVVAINEGRIISDGMDGYYLNEEE